jgi:hypothetical protein
MARHASGDTAATDVPRWLTSVASMSRPPSVSRPPDPSTTNRWAPSCQPSLRTTATSRVPPPRSNTASAPPTGTGRRSTSAKYLAAATGSGTSNGCGQPARWAAAVSTDLRGGPQASGKVSTAGGRNPTASMAAAATVASRAASRSAVATSRSPSSTVGSSIRRFGLGSNLAGSAPARRSASLPATRRPSGAAKTPDGMTGAPSNSSTLVRPSGQRSTATVFEVPRSTLTA